MSGGSFTALAYGLYGEKLFDDYEQRFLKRDVQGELISRALSPYNWGTLGGTATGRSEVAAQLYDEILFNGATFGDLRRGKGPCIMASATDISTGSRFVFSQRVFDVICSDLDAVPLSRAAAASSAVPVVLSPVTFNNYGGTCGMPRRPGCSPSWTPTTRRGRRRGRSARCAPKQSFRDSEQRPFLHLVDGGVSDNVGMRARARCAGGHRGAARSRRALAAGRRAQDHRLRRQFAVHAADRLGPVGERRPARWMCC